MFYCTVNRFNDFYNVFCELCIYMLFLYCFIIFFTTSVYLYQIIVISMTIWNSQYYYYCFKGQEKSLAVLIWIKVHHLEAFAPVLVDAINESCFLSGNSFELLRMSPFQKKVLLSVQTTFCKFKILLILLYKYFLVMNAKNIFRWHRALYVYKPR